MDLYSTILGSHIWFAREGDAFLAGTDQNGGVLGAGVVGLNAKPNAVDVGGNILAPFVDLGAVEDLEPSVAQSDHKLFKPSPGHLVLKEVLETQQELSLKVTTNEISSLAFEAAFRTSAKLSGAVKQFNPLSAVSRRGFIHVQVYDNDDNLVMTWENWVRIRTKLKFAKDPVMPEWEIFCLYSGCNVGLMGN